MTGLECRIPALRDALDGRRAHRFAESVGCGGVAGRECYTCAHDFGEYDHAARSLLATLKAARREERAWGVGEKGGGR